MTLPFFLALLVCLLIGCGVVFVWSKIELKMFEDRMKHITYKVKPIEVDIQSSELPATTRNAPKTIHPVEELESALREQELTKSE